MPIYDTKRLFHFQKAMVDFLERHNVEGILTEFDFKHEAKVYLGSGQMFNEFGRLGLELLADICEAIHLDYYLPQHNTSINDKGADTIITNKLIFDADNDELATCHMMFSHFTIPEDSGLSAECGRFAYMKKVNPDQYYANVAILDDIRSLTEPNPNQKGVENQTIYMNSYTAGAPDYFGETLYDCFKYMYEQYQIHKNNNK
ncbi:hypothetical protein CVD28_01805 [Bacillus sp. M6-12]|uniref:nucleoside 2-deoxyribosyltransferase n=1 Tax=Bacillus sp. M6-12 TaxID=2054166 RepID=UPI000C77EBC6|nr:nucleoside 2-deoxyribosyltransferase [Bacillus sp. M6-12]PLS19167.1 hypothetical protein CVD28_01805 [Bacillus sp. M6-12]